ncbi:hypothetical protein [Hyphomicrobium sp.]|jgi:hypothetical protein|uniref:hypothetical protein n=1 Tax=Hyphomicrobium sp. TaxID=82 RepID=UPI002C943967|nr:hypothetical protein [Hyphomicrobium sp.]HVZ05869.1 hypothetical protein [Hyphomicrobium sp.]
MMAHVAEASELSGRVVLWLDPELRCTPEFLDAPLRLAAAYDAEIETVVVDPIAEDDGACDVPVRRLARGAASEVLAIEHRFELLAERCRREVERAGANRKVKVHHAFAQGDAIDRIAEMCLARGPWNIVALRLPTLGGQSVVGSLLANVSGATGFLLCAEHSASTKSPIVVIVEDADRLPSMLRAAERLSQPDRSIHIVIGAETTAEHVELEQQARLLMADAPTVVFTSVGPTFGVPGVLTEAVARMKPSLIVARFGGAALADGRELTRASAATRAPILLVR